MGGTLLATEGCRRNSFYLMQQTLTILVPILGLLGLGVAFVIFCLVSRFPGGKGKVAEIAGQIERGAMVFMKTEFRLILIFAVVIGVALLFSEAHGMSWSLAFFFGCAASSFAGFVVAPMCVPRSQPKKKGRQKLSVSLFSVALSWG